MAEVTEAGGLPTVMVRAAASIAPSPTWLLHTPSNRPPESLQIWWYTAGCTSHTSGTYVRNRQTDRQTDRQSIIVYAKPAATVATNQKKKWPIFLLLRALFNRKRAM